MKIDVSKRFIKAISVIGVLVILGINLGTVNDSTTTNILVGILISILGVSEGVNLLKSISV